MDGVSLSLWNGIRDLRTLRRLSDKIGEYWVTDMLLSGQTWMSISASKDFWRVGVAAKVPNRLSVGLPRAAESALECLSPQFKHCEGNYESFSRHF